MQPSTALASSAFDPTASVSQEDERQPDDAIVGSQTPDEVNAASFPSTEEGKGDVFAVAKEPEGDGAGEADEDETRPAEAEPEDVEGDAAQLLRTKPRATRKALVQRRPSLQRTRMPTPKTRLRTRLHPFPSAASPTALTSPRLSAPMSPETTVAPRSLARTATSTATTSASTIDARNRVYNFKLSGKKFNYGSTYYRKAAAPVVDGKGGVATPGGDLTYKKAYYAGEKGMLGRQRVDKIKYFSDYRRRHRRMKIRHN
ncbi:hypothetical protein HK101_009042 [Irineochytrium annulatum]|nr:hypothetical protein HK101_009042 [Irineochytrium annulatum]